MSHSLRTVDALGRPVEYGLYSDVATSLWYHAVSVPSLSAEVHVLCVCRTPDMADSYHSCEECVVGAVGGDFESVCSVVDIKCVESVSTCVRDSISAASLAE